MALTRTSIDVEPPFGPAIVKRSLPIDRVVEERSPTSGAWTPKDISAARYTYRLRIWESDDDTNPLDDQEITKGADTGQLRYDYPCGATVQDALLWEIVQVDNDNGDANSRTTKVEIPKLRWKQPIIDAP